MYGLVVNNSQPTAQQVEDQLDGNLCRYLMGFFFFFLFPALSSSTHRIETLSRVLHQVVFLANGRGGVEGIDTNSCSSGFHGF
jgi:hypothetical protein